MGVRAAARVVVVVVLCVVCVPFVVLVVAAVAVAVVLRCCAVSDTNTYSINFFHSKTFASSQRNASKKCLAFSSLNEITGVRTGPLWRSVMAFLSFRCGAAFDSACSCCSWCSFIFNRYMCEAVLSKTLLEFSSTCIHGTSTQECCVMR